MYPVSLNQGDSTDTTSSTGLFCDPLDPDLYDHIYVREMTDLCLKGIGFKQLCIQQVRAVSSPAGLRTD